MRPTIRRQPQRNDYGVDYDADMQKSTTHIRSLLQARGSQVATTQQSTKNETKSITDSEEAQSSQPLRNITTILPYHGIAITPLT